MYIRIQKREELLSDGLSKLCKSRYELTGSMRFQFHNFYRTLSIKKLHRDGLYKVVFVKFFTRACAGRVYLLE